MSKISVAGLTALFITAISPAYAQMPPGGGAVRESLNEAELKAFTDQRVDMIKSALQLTPAQEKYWPAVEDAIRGRADSRHARLATIGARASEQRERSPVEFLRERADAAAQRSAALQKLADAWEPLYDSLDNRQKVRLRVLTLYVLRDMRDAVESRRLQSEDEFED